MTTTKQHSQKADAQLYCAARLRMESFGVASSLSRYLWDATVREHDRLAAENARLREAGNAAIGALAALRACGTLAEEVARADALLLAADAEAGLRAALAKGDA